MIYILYGPDEYRRAEKTKELFRSFYERIPLSARASFSLDEEGSLENLYSFVVSEGLFEEGKKVAIVKEGLLLLETERMKLIIDLAARNNKIVLLFSEPWSRKSLSGAQKLLFDKAAKTQFFEKLSEESAVRFLMALATKEEILIEGAACRMIIRACAGDLEAAVNEIKKMSLLSQPLSASFVSSLLKGEIGGGLFSLARSFASAPLSVRLREWEKICFFSPDWFLIFAYLVKSAEKEPVARALFEADVKVKSGLLEIDQAMLEVLLAIPTRGI